MNAAISQQFRPSTDRRCDHQIGALRIDLHAGTHWSIDQQRLSWFGRRLLPDALIGGIDRSRRFVAGAPGREDCQPYPHRSLMLALIPALYADKGQAKLPES